MAKTNQTEHLTIDILANSYRAIASHNVEVLRLLMSNNPLLGCWEKERQNIINASARGDFVEGLKLLLSDLDTCDAVLRVPIIGRALINAAQHGKWNAVDLLLSYDPSTADLKQALHGAIVQSIDPQWHGVVDAIWNEMQDKHIDEVIEDITTDYKEHASMYGCQKWAAHKQSKLLHQQIDATTPPPPHSSLRSKI